MTIKIIFNIMIAFNLSISMPNIRQNYFIGGGRSEDVSTGVGLQIGILKNYYYNKLIAVYTARNRLEKKLIYILSWWKLVNMLEGNIRRN